MMNIFHDAQVVRHIALLRGRFKQADIWLAIEKMIKD